MLGKRKCCCSTPTGCDCVPCTVPQASVTLSTAGGTPSPMVWQDPDCSWLLDLGNDVSFLLSCGPSGMIMFWNNFDESETMTFRSDLSTCSPLHLVFDSILVGPAQYFVDYP